MSYEFRVTELAGEFNVHRNTIRNWINSGILPAEKTAGRRYRVKKADYTRLCEKFGRKPLEHTSSEPDLEALRAMTAGSSPPPLHTADLKSPPVHKPCPCRHLYGLRFLCRRLPYQWN